MYTLPRTVDNLHEFADSLLDSKELHVCTSMILPDYGLCPIGSGKLHRSLSTDDYQALETAVRGLHVVD
ncbi:hypothetical protein COP1_007667 [Malus domestica]